MLTIDVIIPAKNEGMIIKNVITAVKNAINECDFDVNIIVVDNDSTDNTRELAKEMGCKVILDYSNAIAKLRNVGAHSSSAEILAFLDADCLVDPGWVRLCIENFCNDKIAIVGTRAVPDFTNATWVERGWYNLFSGVSRPDYPDWLGTSNLFVRKYVFDGIGGFDESLGTAEDVDFCRRVSANHLIYLEKRVDTIHLRESKSIPDLFKREVRRGKFSLRQFFKSNVKSKELFSAFVPLFIVIMFALGVVALISSFYKLSIALLLLTICVLPLLLIFKKKALVTSVVGFAGVYAVATTYLFARAVAACQELAVILNTPSNSVK